MKAELRVYSTAIVIIAPYRELHNLMAFHELIRRAAELKIKKGKYIFSFYKSEDETDYKDIIEKLRPDIEEMNLDENEKEDIMMYHCNRKRCFKCGEACDLTGNIAYSTGEYMTIRESRNEMQREMMNQ